MKELQRAVQYAHQKGLKVSISGNRHSHGGHAFSDDAVVLDMTSFNKILGLDVQNKVIRVQSGATWEQIQAYVNPYRLAVNAMQSSNIFPVGGSMSSNIHGRDPNSTIIIETIRSFRLLRPDGAVINVSRTENHELFRLVVGGYGLFIARPSIAPSSLLRETVVTTWKTTNRRADNIFALQHEANVARDRFFFGLSRKHDWGKELRWTLQKRLVAQPGKTKIVSRNNAMRPPTAPLKFLDHDSSKDTDIIQEYFIPTGRFVPFIDGAREIFSADDVNLLGVTIRYVEQNEEAFLSYARTDSFSIMCYTNQRLSATGLERAERMTQKLVGLALANDGTYYLTYQLFPTQEQIRKAYPNIDAFFAMKRQYDEKELFINKFYEKYAGGAVE